MYGLKSREIVVSLSKLFLKRRSKTNKKAGNMKTKITNKEQKQIDWNKPQLLISENGIIVLTNGNHKKDMFEGTTLNNNNSRKISYFSDAWIQSKFKPFNGEITLSND